MTNKNCFNFLTESSDVVYDIALVGAGPSNLFAAFVAGMLNMRVILIDALPKLGGQCSSLYSEKNIYDIPSRKSISAGDLINNLIDQASRFSPDCLLENLVESIDGSIDSLFLLKTNKNNIIKAKRVILGIGNGSIESKKLNVPESDRCESKSLFYSVDSIDSFIGKKVAIIGGGDSAVDWTVMLSEIASKISIIHRRDRFSCYPEKEARLRELLSNDVIEFISPYVVSSIGHSGGFIKKVFLKNLECGSIKSIEVDCILAFFGLAANLEHAKNWGVEVSKNNRINVNLETLMTKRNGVYAIGDIANNKKNKLILTGFSEAEIACSHIRDSIYPDGKIKFEYSTTKFEDAV